MKKQIKHTGMSVLIRLVPLEAASFPIGKVISIYVFSFHSQTHLCHKSYFGFSSLFQIL